MSSAHAYYNEHDAYAAAWLRNLIDAGHIASGVVDERSIEDVCPRDLDGFVQCHFFAGIGVWPHALRSAGWPDDRPVWTGSCPCQPFSAAGKGAGFADERHLWPAWHHLIGERRPATVFGEQVASPDSGPWIDLVQDDLEALGYAFGAVPFPAASVGAPHIRDRLYFVAKSDDWRRKGQGLSTQRRHGCGEPLPSRCGEVDRGRPAAEGRGCVGACGLADTAKQGPQGREQSGQRSDAQRTAVERSSAFGDVEHPQSNGWQPRRAESGWRSPIGGRSASFWSDAEWIACRDGKARPVEPGTFPLAHGVAGRVGQLRAYGNAICAPAAAAFVMAFV